MILNTANRFEKGMMLYVPPDRSFYRLRTMLRFAVLLLGCLVGRQSASAQSPETYKPDAAGYQQKAAPFLKKHCAACHGAEEQEGDFRVDEHLPNDFVTRSSVEKWTEVLHMLQSGQMPPEDRPRPDQESLQQVIDWITAQRVHGEQHRSDRSLMLRRMNRAEYNNTIHDLLSLDIEPAADFPADPAAGGFDNVGSALTISPLHLEMYVAAAQRIIDRAIVTEAQPPTPIRWRFQPEEGNQGLDRYRVNIDGQRILVNAGNNQIREGMTVLRFSGWDRNCGFRAFKVPHSGEYVIRIRAAGITPAEEAARKAGPAYHLHRQQEQESRLATAEERRRRRSSFDRYVWPSVQEHFANDRCYRYGPPRLKIGGTLGGRIRVIKEFDVEAPVDKPEVYEATAWFDPTPAGVSISNVYQVPRHQHNFWFQTHDEFPRPELLIDWIELEGPIHPQWPPASHTAIFIDSPHRGKDEVAYARDVLAHFMRKAYRRPLLDEEVASKVALFKRVRPSKPSFEEAIKTPLIAVLASPHFLYMVEEQSESPVATAPPLRKFRDKTGRTMEARILRVRDDQVLIERADGAKFTTAIDLFAAPDQEFIRKFQPVVASPRRKLNDHALAVRLSYFLWSTMPDKQLFELADAGRLSQPQELRQQVQRMLTDPKAQALVENFAGQWLGLREIGANPPSREIYPRYDDHLEVSLRGESEAFFQHILQNDLPVKNFLQSDFVTVNERLARHYDLRGVSGDAFRPVQVPADSHRGGLLTQASILSITSNGTRTSPVNRGVWVLENLLGDPPPPPPPNAGDIPPGVPGIDKVTVRERLKLHREQTQCARCHNQIDPLGFALENFNAAGEWREQETQGNRTEPRQDDPPIDASAQLPDGQTFVGVEGLQQQLLQREEQFRVCLAEKMIAYALGRELGYADQPAINQAAAAMQKQGSTVRELIQHIVGSEAFQAK